MLARASRQSNRVFRDFPNAQLKPFVRAMIAYLLVVFAQSLMVSAQADVSVRAEAFKRKPLDEAKVKERAQLALAYLLAKQSKDGSWRSEYYGNLKQGAAVTSTVLFALSHCSKPMLGEEKLAIEKAYHFLKKGIRKHGFAANESGPDYANYATALTLLSEKNFKSHHGWEFLTIAERSKLVQFLVDSQLDETHGMTPKSDDYGGWDLSGWVQEPRFSPGTNISISSFVLLALKDEKGKSVELARSKARKWISKVRNDDQGFYFHPKKDHAGNKAEWDDDHSQRPNSYGTATVDGIRALRSLGAPLDQIKATAKWLTDHSETEHGITFVPGFELDPQNRDSSWGQGLVYYYLMSLALEKEHLPKAFEMTSRKRVPEFLMKHQKKDGRWENSSARMREDDPLIATPLALIALLRFSSKP